MLICFSKASSLKLYQAWRIRTLNGFVKKMTFTLGNVHDSQEFDKLLDCGRAKDKLKTCGEVYADSAYANN
jgi:hypothetical protein